MRRTIINYDALLKAAAQQTEPQRLLFVFAQPELPDDHGKDEAERFHAGQGGALNPIMYVDKTLEELSTFSALVSESQQMKKQWQIVFVGALAGRNGQLPSSEEAQATLDIMAKSIQMGAVSNFLAYDRDGNSVQFV